jgi:hypothetical protein
MTEVSPNILGSWMGIAFVALNGIGVLFGILAFFATRRDVDAIEKRVAGMETEFRMLPEKFTALERHLGEEGGRRVEKVADRIELVRRELADKLDNVESNIIATLKQTGAIK